jgi:hypothetical protein
MQHFWVCFLRPFEPPKNSIAPTEESTPVSTEEAEAILDRLFAATSNGQ